MGNRSRIPSEDLFVFLPNYMVSFEDSGPKKLPAVGPEDYLRNV